MRKKLKNPNKFVRGKLAGLNHIADWINMASEVEGPNRPFLEKIELILEAMTGQPPRKKNVLLPIYRKGKLIPLNLTAPKRSFFDCIAMPSFAVDLFNDLVKENPVPLKLGGEKKAGKIELFPDYKGLNTIQAGLLLLWEYYFKDGGWQRLNRCPECEKWYVDDTRNKSKERCSAHCTNLWWTRARRKEAGHGKPKAHKRGR